MKYIFRAVLLMVFFNSAYAHDTETLFNQVHLQAQAEKDIPNDQLTVIMAVEKEGKDAAIIADEINQAMQWALKRANKNQIETKTLSYNTYPVYDKRVVIGWRATQQLELKSTEIAMLSKLVGDLQQRLQVKSMRFNPTKALREQYANELIVEAMQSFKNRVNIIKQQMDNQNYRIVNLHINTGGGHPQPVYAETRMMAMDSMAKSSPAVEAGSSKLIVTVSGSVQFF